MPRKCCVPGCRSNYLTEGKTVSVFTFPKDVTLRQKWIKAIHRDNFKPTKQNVVCVNHFIPKFVIREEERTLPDGSITMIPKKRIKLSNDAYPSLFQNQSKHKSTNVQKINSDEINDITDLKTKQKFKLQKCKCVITETEDCIYFLNIHYSRGSPEIKCSLKICNDLSFQVFANSTSVCRKDLPDIFQTSHCNKWSKLKKMLNYICDFDQDKALLRETKVNVAICNLQKCLDNDLSGYMNYKLTFVIELLQQINKDFRKSSSGELFEIKNIFSDLNNIKCNDMDDEHINSIYEDFDSHIDVVQISKHEQIALVYIGGYIAHSLQGRLECEYCVKSLTISKMFPMEVVEDSLLYLKDLDIGALKVPSDIVMEIVTVTYKTFQVLIGPTYEEVFLKGSNQRDILIKISVTGCDNIELICKCSESNEVKTKCIALFANILLGNYRKVKK